MISLKNLHYIVSVADHRSVTLASKALNISQPAISFAIQQVERATGIDIFIRHHARGISLTASGRKFVNAARQLLNHAQDFNSGVQSLSSAVSGEITVGCFLTLATRFMPSLLAEFSKKYPSITIHLEEGNQQEITDGLMNGSIEVAIAYTYALPVEINSTPLMALPPYILVSENHPLAYRKIVSIYEFADEPLILLDLPLSRDYFLQLFQSCNITPQIIYKSSSYELIRGLVGHGHGYTIHNALPGTSFAYDGSRTVVLRIKEDLQSAQVTCLTLNGYNIRPAVKVFQEYIKKEFSPQGLYAHQNLYNML